MNTKQLIGLALLAAGGYLLYKKKKTGQLAASMLAQTETPLTEVELENFSPLEFRRGETCP